MDIPESPNKVWKAIFSPFISTHFLKCMVHGPLYVPEKSAGVLPFHIFSGWYTLYRQQMFVSDSGCIGQISVWSWVLMSYGCKQLQILQWAAEAELGTLAPKSRASFIWAEIISWLWCLVKLVFFHEGLELKPCFFRATVLKHICCVCVGANPFLGSWLLITD